MTRTLRIESDIKVKPKGRPRFVRGIAITDSATRAFEKEVKTLFLGLCREPFEGPLIVELHCFFVKPKSSKFSYPPKGDCDNLFKSIADAGNGVLWKDDSQIVRIVCSKSFASQEGFCLTIIEDVEE